MNEQILLYLIVALFCILVGGAGGATLFRRITKYIVPDETTSVAATVATTASTVAATVAATASSVASALRSELTGQMGSLEQQLAANTARLTDLEIAINRFMGACPERHQAIAQRLDGVDKRLDDKHPRLR